ncbi:hypothetical protein FJ959_22190 [Mesorhizobium sp. B2-2-4]|uniref:hypothetical protein n=1 Tax=unclassified Mesorhizobium TaxID=325217 RepID=UPI001127E9D2|nr:MULTISPECIES: hypothetical protein [unclassified Mesorhizobium]TPM53244.1 hypothetical protein FJ959_22190 [Mesorhizobium sp. B2-2-4]TPM62114.1 hypothetical protein FJ965_21180 [Mesorhizobium sp. B2-2-1]TPN68485.1 hypothetical protein FJ984_11660 [Mesorhizobium sp. B1-1-3]
MKSSTCGATLVDDGCHLSQELESRVAVRIVKRERAIEPGTYLSVDAAVPLNSRQFEPLEQLRSYADMDCDAVLRRHGCDLWRKGLQPEIGPPDATNVPLCATSYPQASKLIITA